MDRVQHHGPLITPELRRAVGGKQLGKQPARPMDGRHQTDEGGGGGHRGDKERQDRAKGAETKSKAKEAAVDHIDDHVMA